MNFFTSPAFALAVIFVAALSYTLYAKIKAGKAPTEAPAAAKKAEAPAAVPVAAANISSGELELVETDEKTAAVVMAIVSHQSGIPLNRLKFESIRLMEDK